MTYFLENVKAETNKALEFAVNLGISIPNPFSSFFFFFCCCCCCCCCWILGKHHRRTNSTWASSLGVVSEISESAKHVEYSASKVALKSGQFIPLFSFRQCFNPLFIYFPPYLFSFLWTGVKLWFLTVKFTNLFKLCSFNSTILNKVLYIS